MNKEKKAIHINLIVLIVIIVLIIIGIRLTMARYRSEAETTTDVDIAFFVVKDEYQEGNIFLENLYPSETPFDYTFTISNSDGTNTAETSIDYTVDLEVTTNLPLEFKIYKNGTLLTSESDIENTVALDSSNQCYIRTIKIKKGNLPIGTGRTKNTSTDTYKVAVTFPISYNTHEEYEGIIDNINIKLDSKQKID